jgi:Spy/CpxP family protein refolding chaperone
MQRAYNHTQQGRRLIKEANVKVFVIATAALLVSMPAAAQQHGQHGQHRQHEGQGQHMAMMEHCMGMMGGPGMILHHADELGLTADQVSRLEAIRDEAHAGEHMHHGMQAHRQAAELLAADQPDIAAYEALLTQAAGHMVRAHTRMAEAVVEARAVLTAEQRARLAQKDHSAMGHHQGHGGAEAGEHGGKQGPHGMMGCRGADLP